MLVRSKRGWELPESAATPEAAYLNRRQWLTAAGSAALIAAAAPFSALAGSGAADPSAGLYPVKRNEAFKLDRPMTSEMVATTYNNFYEFGSQKQIHQAAQRLAIRPWTVTFDGLVEEKKTVGIDELLKAMPLEERLYRLRCVEAWAMAVPWSGFALKSLVNYARPLSSAKYVEMRTFMDPDVAYGQRQHWYPWPYMDALTIEEATNELAFIATGMYGKPIPRQNGAPLRLAVPWKYGFKSVKSIVSFTFTDKRPVSFWQATGPSEYGFWANVNPEVAHPRWSQAQERLIGTDQTVPTQIFNGYGEWVAGLYKGLEKEKLFS